MIGVTRNTICVRLAMMRGISRNLAEAIPSDMAVIMPLMTSNRNPGTARSAAAPGQILKYNSRAMY